MCQSSFINNRRTHRTIQHYNPSMLQVIQSNLKNETNEQEQIKKWKIRGTKTQCTDSYVKTRSPFMLPSKPSTISVTSVKIISKRKASPYCSFLNIMHEGVRSWDSWTLVRTAACEDLEVAQCGQGKCRSQESSWCCYTQ